MNSRWVGYLILAGLFLVIVGAGCVSPAEPVSAGDQPTLLASPTVSVAPVATRMPQALAPTPATVGIAVDIGQGPITEPSYGVQPQADRTPTRLVIPAIGLDAPVDPVGWQAATQNGQSVNVLDAPNHFAAGWLRTSAPVGVAGNTVLDGHHNIYGKVFKDLVKVQVGYTITLYADGQERTYRVDQKLILAETGQPLKVRQANAQYIAPTLNERLTLVTCWPPNGNSHRLIIVARPVSISPGVPAS